MDEWDTGFLVRDLNADGVINDVSEMFGSPSVDGFAKLATLDSNHNLKIDANDSAWSTLQVWIDSNGNAITDAGELHTLASVVIESIDLAGVTSSTATIDGNSISHTSTVTFTGGTTAAIDDAWFTHSHVDTFYNGWFTLDPDVGFMPDLRGFGNVAQLSIAMSDDSTLKGMVSDFVSGFHTSGFASFTDSDVADILYQWGGVADVDTSSRGPNVNAQDLEFLEHLFGQEFLQHGTQSNPAPQAGADIEQSWGLTFELFKNELILQSGGETLFANAVTYNPWTGTVSGDTSLSQSGITALEDNAPAPGTANLDYWVEVAKFVDSLRGLDNLTTDENSWLNTAIQATDSTLTWDNVKSAVSLDVPGDTITGTSGADTLTGTSGDDTITGAGGYDTVDGLGGNDTISVVSGTVHGGYGDDTITASSGANYLYGDAGNDTIHGGTGNDTIYGGTGGNYITGASGNNTYVFGGGDDVIHDSGGSDQIILPSGITLSDLTFERVPTDGGGYNDLLINVASGGSIQIDGQFGASASFHVETLVFSDSSTLDLTTITNYTAILSDANDTYSNSSSSNQTILGLGGNDTLTSGSGADRIDGGNGNDALHGGTGDDTYVASPGFDTIYETGGTDTIEVASGYSISDVTFLRSISHPNDLTININGLGQIEVTSQFSNANDTIDYLHFIDGNSTVALSGLSYTTIGTESAETINGITSGASPNDSLYGRGGADTLNGNSGDDLLDGGTGNDGLNGGTGNDTYVIQAGWGADTVNESLSSGTDTISFTGIDPAAIRMWTTTNGYLHLEYTSDTSNSITINGGVTGSNTDETKVGQYVESITFDDAGHTTWDLTGGLTLTLTNSGGALYGSASGDTLNGGTGVDTLYGNAGNDTIVSGGGADSMTGGPGNDTYRFASGFGSATVTESTGNGTDTVNLTGLDPANIRLYTTSNGYLHIQDLSDSSHNITLVGGVTGTGTDETKIGLYVEQITFDSGYNTTWDLTGGLTLTGTSGADTLYGSAYGDHMYGLAGGDALYGNSGDDTLYGGSGNDTLNGGTGADTADYSTSGAAVTANISTNSATGDGTDTFNSIENVTGSGYNDTITGDGNANVLSGGAGADTITGGAGNDTINGDSGADTLYGGTGSDTFLFKAATAFSGVDSIQDFTSGSGNDKIDLKDVISGYDPATMAITDWVQITTVGSDSVVKVDTDGTGSGQTWTQIATIVGVTGLTDEAALVASGNLIAH